MIKTAIFDMGGTLQDSYPLYDYIPGLFPEVDKDLLYSFSKDEFRKLNLQEDFVTISEKLRGVLKDISHKFRCKDISDNAEKYLFEFYLDRSVLFDEAVPLLDYLTGKNVELILASDADIKLLKSVLIKHDLAGYFNKMLVSEEIRAYKSSEKYINILRNILPEKYDKNEIIFAGDTEADIITARKLNITSILMNKDGVEKNFNQDYTVKSLKEIIDIIEQI